MPEIIVMLVNDHCTLLRVKKTEGEFNWMSGKVIRSDIFAKTPSQNFAYAIKDITHFKIFCCVPF